MQQIIKYSIALTLFALFFWGCEYPANEKGEETEPLTQPELLTPLNEAIGQSVDIELNWKKIRGAKEYNIQIATNEDFSTMVTDTLVEGTSYSANDLQHETTYFWKVLPLKNKNSGPWSDVWTFTTASGDSEPVTTELLSPENGEEVEPSEITFEWASVENAEQYIYQIAADTSFEDPVYDSLLTSTTVEIDDLEDNQEYAWRVSPVLSSERGEWSEVHTVTVLEATSEKPQVQLQSPENNTSNISTDITLDWETIDRNSEYQVQLSESSDFSSVQVDDLVSRSSYEITDLNYEHTYYWRVQLVGDGEDVWSDVWSFETQSEPQQAPKVTLLSPVDMAADVSIDTEFEWSEESGFTDYQIQIYTSDDFTDPEVDEVVTGTTFEANNLDYEQTYYWRVQVVAEGEEVWSDIYSFDTETEPVVSPPPSSSGFVQVQNGDFVLNGDVFRFAGTNAYYLPNYEKINSGVVDRALDLFEDTGVNVVRMWGFYDGYDCGYSAQDPSENVIQTAPGEYSEEALRDLDRVIAKGKERGIRFIMPFINYWDQLGGLCQYNTWASASNPSRNMDFFINNEQTQQWFRDYIEMLLNRVNTVTGVAYKDEPAIFAWQIINEGRYSGQNPELLRDWYQEIAQYIKSIDSNHLLSTGEEGFDEGTPSEYSEEEYSNTYALRANEGTSYIMNTAIPEIDFGNAHWYPADYGFGSSEENMLQAQQAWFSDHKSIAESFGKPFIVGEYGYAGWGNETVESIYNELYDHAENIELDGNLIWQLVADGTKCWEFGGNICYPDGRADEDMYNAFKAHVATIKATD